MLTTKTILRQLRTTFVLRGLKEIPNEELLLMPLKDILSICEDSGIDVVFQLEEQSEKHWLGRERWSWNRKKERK